MQRNQFFLPKKTSPFTTLKYLEKVIKKKVFAPKHSDIRLKACPVLPSRNELIAAIRDVERAKRFTLGIPPNGPFPDVKWMVCMLSTYAPNHRFFDKDFYPEPKPRKN